MEDGKYTQVGNRFDEIQFTIIDICAIKTTLLPTVKIASGNEILCPQIIEKDGKTFLRNVYKSIDSIPENSYIFIPKIDNVEKENDISKITAWLYGKYIVSGYVKSNSVIPQMFIPVKHITKKQEKQILSIDSTVIVNAKDANYRKIIISNNTDLIEMFSNGARQKTLKKFIIESKRSIYNVFLHSLLMETDDIGRIQIDNQILAHEIFIHTLSKLDKILKITEERVNKNKKKSNAKRRYFIQQTTPEDYEIIAGNVYTRILQNRFGRNTVGVDIDKNHIYLDDDLVCNSLVMKNTSINPLDI